MQKLDDKVDVSQDHASAAVPLASKLVESLTTSDQIIEHGLAHILPQRSEKLLAGMPALTSQNGSTYEVDTFSRSIKSKYLFHLLPTTYRIVRIQTPLNSSTYLAASEASDRNDHCL